MRSRPFKPGRDTTKLLFELHDSCSSNLGMKTGPGSAESPSVAGTIWLGHDCPSVLHEVIHALGFQHEFIRPDRNQFIKVQFDNILKGE